MKLFSFLLSKFIQTQISGINCLTVLLMGVCYIEFVSFSFIFFRFLLYLFVLCLYLLIEFVLFALFCTVLWLFSYSASRTSFVLQDSYNVVMFFSGSQVFFSKNYVFRQWCSWNLRLLVLLILIFEFTNHKFGEIIKSWKNTSVYIVSAIFLLSYLSLFIFISQSKVIIIEITEYWVSYFIVILHSFVLYSSDWN